MNSSTREVLEKMERICLLALAAVALSGCATATWRVEQAADPAATIAVAQPGGDVRQICGFTPQNDLVVLTKNRRLVLLDGQTGREKRCIQTFRRNTTVEHLTLTSNGLLAYSFNNRRQRVLTVWDISADPPKQTMRLSPVNWQSFIKFSPDGSTLAIGGGNSGVKLWNPRTGKQVGKLETPEGMITNITLVPQFAGFSENGKYLAVNTIKAKRDPSQKRGTRVIDTRVFSVKKGTLLHQWRFLLPRNKLSIIGILSISNDGRRVLISEKPSCVRESVPGHFRLFDTASGNQILDVEGFCHQQYNSRWFVVRLKGKLGVYSMETGKRILEFPEQTTTCLSGNLFAVVAQKREPGGVSTITFHDLSKETTIGELHTPESYLSWLKVSPNEQFVMTSLGRILNRPDGKTLYVLKPHEGKCLHLRLPVFSADSTRMAFLNDGAVGIVNLDLLKMPS